ncbi:Hypothetical predicted protein [Olea europaea subsp. europaea]|uniref:Uncharacterized protein n=1 Tax=Olea europaea subsp. europaea TaxID=158383 RepID=A0A8S0SE33_OLEEU|nr:Hypothetical predicted protein [Olea europaea subsp. europaea]
MCAFVRFSWGKSAHAAHTQASSRRALIFLPAQGAKSKALALHNQAADQELKSNKGRDKWDLARWLALRGPSGGSYRATGKSPLAIRCETTGPGPPAAGYTTNSRAASRGLASIERMHLGLNEAQELPLRRPGGRPVPITRQPRTRSGQTMIGARNTGPDNRAARDAARALLSIDRISRFDQSLSLAADSSGLFMGTNFLLGQIYYSPVCLPRAMMKMVITMTHRQAGRPPPRALAADPMRPAWCAASGGECFLWPRAHAMSEDFPCSLPLFWCRIVSPVFVCFVS